jgi:hypothetical protein
MNRKFSEGLGRDTDLREGLRKDCMICKIGLMNSMEQLVECCPFCYRTEYSEKGYCLPHQEEFNDD